MLTITSTFTCDVAACNTTFTAPYSTPLKTPPGWSIVTRVGSNCDQFYHVCPLCYHLFQAYNAAMRNRHQKQVEHYTQPYEVRIRSTTDWSGDNPYPPFPAIQMRS